MTHNDLYISWAEYHQTIERLAAKIHQSQWNFDSILCLARGGLRIGDLLSRIYNKPLAILAVSSYGGEEERIRGAIHFAQHLTSVNPLDGRVLLVDDLVDSGVSMQETIKWLNTIDDCRISEIRTAVLWYKSCSVFQPDYYVEYLGENPWIHQPFADYEKITPTELADRYSLSYKLQTSYNPIPNG